MRTLAFATFLVWRLRTGACGVGACGFWRYQCPPIKPTRRQRTRSMCVNLPPPHLDIRFQRKQDVRQEPLMYIRPFELRYSEGRSRRPWAEHGPTYVGVRCGRLSLRWSVIALGSLRFCWQAAEKIINNNKQSWVVLNTICKTKSRFGDISSETGMFFCKVWQFREPSIGT